MCYVGSSPSIYVLNHINFFLSFNEGGKVKIVIRKRSSIRNLMGGIGTLLDPVQNFIYGINFLKIFVLPQKKSNQIKSNRHHMTV